MVHHPQSFVSQSYSGLTRQLLLLHSFSPELVQFRYSRSEPPTTVPPPPHKATMPFLFAGFRTLLELRTFDNTTRLVAKFGAKVLWVEFSLTCIDFGFASYKAWDNFCASEYYMRVVAAQLGTATQQIYNKFNTFFCTFTKAGKIPDISPLDFQSVNRTQARLEW